MPSNDFTRRRAVLKRPTVCKNQRKIICGDCTLLLQLDASIYLPGENVEVEAEMQCDPPPRDTTYHLILHDWEGLHGPFGPWLVGTIIKVSLAAPTTVGVQQILALAENSTRCRVPAQAIYTVDL